MYHNFKIMATYDFTQKACKKNNVGHALIPATRYSESSSPGTPPIVTESDETMFEEAELESQWTQAEMEHKFTTEYVEKSMVPAGAQFLTDILKWYIFDDEVPNGGGEDKSVESESDVYYLNQNTA